MKHIAAMLIGVASASCSMNESIQSPLALSLDLGGQEDTAIHGRLVASHSDEKPIEYRIVRQPANGVLSVDSASGDFSYEPFPDFNGIDQFHYVAFVEPNVNSLPATVQLMIAAVNDPPRIEPMPDATNSAFVREVTIPFFTYDVDGDLLTITVTSSNSNVAVATLDEVASTIGLTPIASGDTTVRLSVSDAEFVTQEEFTFSVGQRTKTTTISLDNSTQAIEIRNTSNDFVELSLSHNGFRSFTSLEDIAEHVRQLPAQYPGEGFDRKLWRFLRDFTLHDYPLTKTLWIYDPLVTVNSLGWGFCSHLAAAYAQISIAAGFGGRVWELSGHVVPEIWIDGSWSMYDPDLAVYYHTTDGRAASVEELVSDASLLTSPVLPIFPHNVYRAPYTQSLADIYVTRENNRIADEYLEAHGPFDGLIRLPPGGTLIYPGRWTEAPTGHDGPTSFPVSDYLQALLTFPAGFSGHVRMPWVLHEVRGSGIVQIDGIDYEVGGDELTARLRRMNAPVAELEVAGSEGGISFVLFVNTIGFRARSENLVEVTSEAAWALSVATAEIAEVDGSAVDFGPASLKPMSVDFWPTLP